MSSPMKRTDAYKLDHRQQYPSGTEMVFSNWTARGSRLPGVNKVVFFGLQAYLLKTLHAEWKRDFFDMPRDVAVNSYKYRIENAGINIDYDHVGALHDLGYLPLEIWALPEGAAVPIGVPMFVMWNTHPEFFWVTNYIETDLSANLWGPCTSATIAKEYRKIFEYARKITGGPEWFTDYQGHDFSYRGMMGTEAAAMSGAAHLLSFNGTDTLPAIDFLEKYYHGEAKDIGGSVPATEHSVMCMGTQNNEIETYRRLITEVYPKGIVSIVSDTWDYWNVWTNILPALKDDIMQRNGKVVIRPDSGDPVDIICGDYKLYDKTSPAAKGSFQMAWELFGGTKNALGYKELDPHIGLIYGDSITLDRARAICQRLVAQGFVPSVVLGIGSYTYQYVTRDTFGFALKSTAGIVDGKVREIFKAPKTDVGGVKKSARGFTAVYKHDREFVLKDGLDLDAVRSCEFIRVFKDGEPHARCNLAHIREEVRSG